MKTFDEWWASSMWAKTKGMEAVVEAVRQECQNAWNAAKESASQETSVEVNKP